MYTGYFFLEVGFRRSILDAKKTRFLLLRGRRFSNGEFGRQNRQGYRSRRSIIS